MQKKIVYLPKEISKMTDEEKRNENNKIKEELTQIKDFAKHMTTITLSATTIILVITNLLFSVFAKDIEISGGIAITMIVTIVVPIIFSIYGLFIFVLIYSPLKILILDNLDKILILNRQTMIKRKRHTEIAILIFGSALILSILNSLLNAIILLLFRT